MADINARTRLLVGTTADWAAHDLVLGDGELVLERAGAGIKMKAGNGAAKYAALPFLTMTPTVPPEYLTDVEGDARYLKLADVVTVATPDKVPRLNPYGMLPAGMIPLPPAIDSSAGASDAGKLVKTAASGKIDPSLITVTTGGYRGSVDATLPVPAGLNTAGDYYINTGTGLADASWGLPANTSIVPSQQLVFNGVKWDLIGTGAGSLIRLPDGTEPAPSLAFINEASTGLWRPGAGVLAFSTSGVERMRVNATQLLLGGSTYGALGVRDGGVYGGTGPTSSSNGFVVESAGNTGMAILTPNTNNAYIAFGDPENNGAGLIQFVHSTDSMVFATQSVARLTLTAALATVGAGTQVATSAGLETAPAYSFSTVLDMGMFRAASNTLAFSTVGVEKMRLLGSIEAQMLVGVKTTANSASGRGVLEVNGASAAFLGLDTGNATKFYAYCDGNNTSLMQVPTGNLQLGVNGQIKLTINNTNIIDSINGLELGWSRLRNFIQGSDLNVAYAHRGGFIQMTGGNPIIVPGQFVDGDVVTIYNAQSAARTLIQAISTEIRWGVGTYLTGNRTLAPHAFITVVCLNGTNNIFRVLGEGLS
jgi:hypothetical protein